MNKYSVLFYISIRKNVAGVITLFLEVISVQRYSCLSINGCTLVGKMEFFHQDFGVKIQRKGKDSGGRPVNQGVKCLLIYTCMSVPIPKIVT